MRARFSRNVLECASPLALLLGAFSLAAQPIPKLTSISPEWIQRGTTQEVVLTGENLGATTAFIFSGEGGLSASNVPPAAPAPPSITIESSTGGITRAYPVVKTDNKRVIARVIATANASLSTREVRVQTPNGVSNPLAINVSHLPEASETGSNNSLEQAQNISLPIALNGSISAAAQVDYFKFKAKRGEELIFEVDAARRGSALDSSLAVLTPAGKELARSEDANGLDSLVLFTVPDDGEYVLAIRDFRYSGGANFSYRCYVGTLPYVQSVFPLGAQRGKQVEVALTGRNLEGTSKLMLNIDPKSPLGRQEIRASTPKGLSNLIPLDISDFPDLTESEANDSADNANSVSIPVAINGTISAAKDVDRFKFKSDKDQKLVCEVAAYRYGSPLDALLVLTDSKGAVLQRNDDASAADARIEFDAKKDSEYQVALRDLTGRGGDRFAYRLIIRPPSSSESGFQVRFTPDTPRLSRGSHTRVRCEVTRLGGFDGPVRLAWESLPSGVTGEPLVMTTAPASGLMTLSASKDAALGTAPIRLAGTATITSKAMTRIAEPLASDKPVKQGFLTVLDTAPFTVEPVTLTAAIEQNQAARFEVMVQRNEGFMGDVKISADGFSVGKDPITKSFDVREGTLKGSESVTNVKLTAKLDAEVGTRTIVFKGESTIDGAPVVQFSRPVPVTVTEVPFVISSTLTRLSVTALPTNAQSAASEAATTVKLQRRAGFTNEVNLALEGLPVGMIATLDKISANGTETTLKLVATEKAPAGTNSVALVAAGMHNDRNFRHRSGLTLTINLPESIDMPPTLATNAVPAAVGPGK